MNVEHSDISLRAASWTLGGLLTTVALALGIVAAFLAICGHVQEPNPPRPAARMAPMLQVNERSDRLGIDMRARAKLAGPGTGSINEAMRQTAATGWDSQP